MFCRTGIHACFPLLNPLPQAGEEAIESLREFSIYGFRRARNFGFLHPNSKLVKLVQLNKWVVVLPRSRPVVSCTCCGKPMRIVRTRVKCAGDASRSLAPIRETAM